MLSKIGASVKDISFFGILLFLFMYISALLGMELFANFVRFNSEGDLVEDLITSTLNDVYLTAPRANFDDVGAALTTVFILVLGEDWPGVMYDYTRVYSSPWGKVLIPFYFMTIFSLGNLMMLSLFTAILLQNFEGGDDEEEEEADQESNDEDEDEKDDSKVNKLSTR